MWVQPMGQEKGMPFGERHGNPQQYSCLESLMDRGTHYNLWGYKELDTAKVTQHARGCLHFTAGETDAQTTVCPELYNC